MEAFVEESPADPSDQCLFFFFFFNSFFCTAVIIYE